MEYEKAPQVTRERLYLDAMESVLSNAPKVLLDTEGGNNLVYLPLDKLFEHRAQFKSSRRCDGIERAPGARAFGLRAGAAGTGRRRTPQDTLMLGARIIVPLVLIAIIGWFSLFTVDQREYAILFRFEEIQRSDYEPGLHFMIPVVNTVLKFPKRLMYLESEPGRFITKEKKDVIVDSFVKWRIEDVETFYKRTRGDETIARELLFQQINDSLRGEFGKRTVQEVVAGHRGDVTDIVTKAVREKGYGLGVRVVDVRTKRINLPEEVSSAVYDRMRAERERVARQLRSEGAEAAERIRAAADRDRTVILAEAYRTAEQTRGEGDAKSAETYAGGYGRNEEFYSFYRSLNAYKKSFGKNQDILLLDPTSDFFNYFKSPANP